MSTTSIVERNVPCHFAPDPGTVDRAFCEICQAEMTVDRDCEGPTSSIMAMCGSKRKYDAFTCPHLKDDWHVQVVALKEAQRKTPSARIAKMLQEEVAEVLATKTPTKEVSRFWSLGI